MQVFLDRRQRDVDNRYVHTHDQQARAADRKNQVWMGGTSCRINDGSARRACSRKKSILSFRQGVSSRLVFSPRNAVSLNALSLYIGLCFPSECRTALPPLVRCLFRGKCGEDLIGRAHATQPREYLLECETMLFTILTGAGVFNGDKAKAEAGTLPRCGLYPRIGRDSGEDDRIDTTRLKLLLEIGSGKGAPVTFRKQDVAGLKSGRRGNLRKNARPRCTPQVERLVDRKIEEIVEVDADIDNRSALGAKRFRQLYRIGNDLGGWMRRSIHRDDGILEVNENKCCFMGIKLKFCHGTP